MNELEKRIATALTENVASADLATLIGEVDDAIVSAKKGVEQARVRALDPTVLDPAARTALQDADLHAQRLEVALPRLRQRLEEIQAAEYAALWEADYRQVAAECDALAAEFATSYPERVTRLVDLFERMAEFEREVSRINGSAPSGEKRRLREVELVARNLERFTRDEPSIITELKLPDWTHSARMAWPLPRPFDPSLFAPVVSGDPRLSTGDWWKVGEEQAATAREQEEQEAKEREAKKLENYHGPRWWERPTG